MMTPDSFPRPYRSAPPSTPASEAASARAEGETSLSPASILLVDDDPSVRIALGRALEMEGWQVTLADGGEDALEILQGREFNLMITDLRMGAVNGWDLLFHEQLLRPRMTIFVITALPVHVVGGVEAIAAEFFQKPLDIERLLAAVRAYLG